MKSGIKFQEAPMKTLMVIVVIINLFACAANRPSDVSQTGPDPENTVAQQKESAASNPAKPLKSPHGYIITQDYELGRFGGFIGDCTDDQNWPYFWQCMSENSGNSGFK
jgi:hypothetical protein